VDDAFFIGAEFMALVFMTGAFLLFGVPLWVLLASVLLFVGTSRLPAGETAAPPPV
jgi:hypothetical protein